MEYQAQSRAAGRAPETLKFRFRELAALRVGLGQNPDLASIRLPDLPPKVTARSIFKGKRDEAFQEERQRLIQSFFDALATALALKYADVTTDDGSVSILEICGPLEEFISRASARGREGEDAELRAAVHAIEIAEDRQLREAQNAEYEAALAVDRQLEEERRAAEEAIREEARRKREAEEREALEAEARRKAEADAVEKRKENRGERMKSFEAKYVATAGAPQVAVRFRGAGGATLSRSLPASAPVSALFELAEVADWAGAPDRGFDLRTSFPAKSLRECKDQTLQEAGLCPSVALLVAEDDED